jgi:hypothetical protein
MQTQPSSPEEIEHTKALLKREEHNHRMDIAKQEGVCVRCFVHKSTPPYHVCDVCREKQTEGRQRSQAEKKQQKIMDQAATRKAEVDRSIAGIHEIAKQNAARNGTGTPRPIFSPPPENPEIQPETIAQSPATVEASFGIISGPGAASVPIPLDSPKPDEVPLEPAILRMPGLSVRIDRAAMGTNTGDMLDLVLAFIKCNLPRGGSERT